MDDRGEGGKEEKERIVGTAYRRMRRKDAKE